MLRLLIILSVLMSAIGLGPAASAQTAAEPSCHSMPAGEDRDGDHKGHDGAVAVAHVCVGCALVGEPAQATSAEMPAAVPLKPSTEIAPVSFNANPTPPPPRTA